VVEVSDRRAASYALSALVYRHTRWRHRHHRRYGCSHHEWDSVEPTSARTHQLQRNLLCESKCSCGPRRSNEVRRALTAWSVTQTTRAIVTGPELPLLEHAARWIDRLLCWAVPLRFTRSSNCCAFSGVDQCMACQMHSTIPSVVLQCQNC
jgi:hypothetical protein